MKYSKLGGSAYQVREKFTQQTCVKGYRIRHPLYDLYEDGSLTVYLWYSWDGATGWFDVKSIILASCIHDILTEIINNPENNVPPEMQAMADETFRKIEKAEDMPAWERYATYLVVRWYQMRKTYPVPPKKIYDTESAKVIVRE